MGLFNDIKDFKEPCPGCGKDLSFQTKDATYKELYLNQVEFRSTREFYTICPDCRISIRYMLKEEDWHKRTLEDYERTEELY